MFVDIQVARDLATSMLNAQDRQRRETQFRPLVNPFTFFSGGTRSEPNRDVPGHFMLGIGGA